MQYDVRYISFFRKWCFYFFGIVAVGVCHASLLSLKISFLSMDNFIRLAVIYYLMEIASTIYSSGGRYFIFTDYFVNLRQIVRQKLAISTLFFFQIIYGLLLMIIFMLLSFFLYPFISKLIGRDISLSNIMFSLIIAYLWSWQRIPKLCLRYYQKVGLYVALNILIYVIPVIVFFVAFYFFRVNVVADILFIELILSVISAGIFVISILRYLVFYFDWHVAKNALKFGLTFLPKNLIFSFMVSFDLLLAKNFLVDPLRGKYIYALRLSYFCTYIISSFSILWVHYSSRLYSTGRRKDMIEESIYKFFVIVLAILLGFVWFQKEISYLLVPPIYYPSYGLMTIIVLRYVPRFVYVSMRFLALYNRKFWTLSFIAGAAFLISLPFYFILYEHLGHLGFALGAVISVSFVVVFLYIFLWRKWNVRLMFHKMIFAFLVLFIMHLVVISRANFTIGNLVIRLILLALIITYIFIHYFKANNKYFSPNNVIER